MKDDIVLQLGYLTLGTRFKRLGERLQNETQRILEANNIFLPSAQFPLLAALDRLGPLTVGELASTVGISQPGATRTVIEMTKTKLVKVVVSTGDLRQKRVGLTKQGERLVEVGKKFVWPEVERAVRDLCEELRGPLLDQLLAIESGLDAAPLYLRVPQKKARKA